MNRQRNIPTGLLAILLIFSIVVGSVNFTARATEAGEEPETETESEETIPEEHIFLQWDVESSLTYRLDESNYIWVVYDANGNELPNGSGEPVSVGYQLTGYGKWFGDAEVKLTIVNNLQQQAYMRLLFMNDLSAAALAISSTLETENEEAVTFDHETGTLIVAPGATGVITLTITAEVLQQVNAAINEENSIAGWIEVRVDKLEIVVEASSDDSTDGATEAPTEAPTEIPSEAPTEAPTEEPTGTPTEGIDLEASSGGQLIG